MERYPSIVADIMSTPVITVDGNVNVRDAAILMKNKDIGSIIVEDKGRIIGIVTEGDIIERIVSLCIGTLRKTQENPHSSL